MPRLMAWSLLVVGCGGQDASETGGVIDDAALRQAGEDAANWVMYGRTYEDHRFSPLDQIDERNVGELGLAWSLELDTTRGLEATPLVYDGVIYTTSSWSVVHAIDAATGQTIWTFDPEVPRARVARHICCDVVNRGAALYRGKVYVGTLDGRLIALDAANGSEVWSVQTTDTTKPQPITGYPRVANGRVLIGNAGAEYGVRGYVTAYDAETGDEAWRLYTVPDNPALGFESEAMARAAETWSGEWWIVGGGGTAWEGIVYDPELDYAYFGTGNPTAWYRDLRGDAPQDNLYAASIIAVRVSDGEHVWHFQPTPGDNWDYDATQPLMLATLEIDGRARRVIMQASKNGFFYVLDRETGEFISGEAFVEGVSWALGLDPETGRPIESPDAYRGMEPIIASPAPQGAHNWNPMAFSPETGLVYIPAKVGTQAIHAPDPEWMYDPNGANLGRDRNYDGPLQAALDALPDPRGELLAWDPVAQRAAWRAPYPVVQGGGVLATAGNLLFQGRSDGILAAYRATDGEKVWEFDAATGIMAPPITYLVDGIQHVTVMVGWGGPEGVSNLPGQGDVRPGHGRIVTFALGADAPFDPPAFGHDGPPVPAITMDATPEIIAEGRRLYTVNCRGCHGVDAVAGPLPDLRYSTAETHAEFAAIVLGSRAGLGMPAFGDRLNPDQVRAVQAYVLARAGESQ
ncbi:MAG TPA: PQQ-dependent dehydrogenase, methanol/ethanol family [Gammaproteobacteria bacterium]|nr:PQQ-dependent dehydrogenase, methanol/ethanol family [Gammaproteobacteria bacterium]